MFNKWLGSDESVQKYCCRKSIYEKPVDSYLTKYMKINWHIKSQMLKYKCKSSNRKFKLIFTLLNMERFF